MPLQLFDRASLPAMPWKNGGGVTREIACVPRGAGLDGFRWRISIAEVASGGPFSSFAGVDRVITLLEGAGMRLFTPDGTTDHRLQDPLQPWAFAGELPIEAQLVAGACEDFNVMTRRGRCHAEVRVLRASGSVTACGAGVVLATGGSVRLEDAAETFTLGPGQGLWWYDQRRTWTLHNETGAAVLAVAIHEVGDAPL